jgi:hypothetical protein
LFFCNNPVDWFDGLDVSIFYDGIIKDAMEEVLQKYTQNDQNRLEK